MIWSNWEVPFIRDRVQSMTGKYLRAIHLNVQAQKRYFNLNTHMDVT